MIKYTLRHSPKRKFNIQSSIYNFQFLKMSYLKYVSECVYVCVSKCILFAPSNIHFNGILIHLSGENQIIKTRTTGELLSELEGMANNVSFQNVFQKKIIMKNKTKHYYEFFPREKDISLLKHRTWNCTLMIPANWSLNSIS